MTETGDRISRQEVKAVAESTRVSEVPAVWRSSFGGSASTVDL